MKRSVWAGMFISIVAVVFLASGTISGAQTENVEDDPALQEALSHLLYSDSLFEGDDSVMASWLGYGLSKIVWVKQNAPEMMETGAYHSSFEEELYGRESLVKIWKELKEKDTSLQDGYLDEFVIIYDAGYLREYVWAYFTDGTWDGGPEGSRMEEFVVWQVENLPEHQPITLVGLDFEQPIQ